MDIMGEFPDQAFDLAIVDPPYGIGAGGKNFIGTKKRSTMVAPPGNYAAKDWDKEPPPPEYFQELRRVSKHQIIWGANHFISRLPLDSSCWIVWDKDNGDSSFADVELAWTSLPGAARKFTHRWAGMMQENMAEKETRIHPTQKPVALYKWLLSRFSTPGQRILDTHLGSGSHAIASHYFGTHLTAIEKDPDYTAAALDRYQNQTQQQDFFTGNPLL